jgi:uncharacterized membrane protein
MITKPILYIFEIVKKMISMMKNIKIMTFHKEVGKKHRSDIRNTSISQRCSKKSIFKYFKKIIIKIQRLENWPLYKVF